MSRDETRGVNKRGVARRRVLSALAGAGTTALAGCSMFERDGDATPTGTEPPATAAADTPTTPVETGRARELAVEFAPTLYFDEHERWFPTDPRPYATGDSEGAIVDGFDAFDGYTARYRDDDAPPDPAVFYHVVEYEDSPLAVVQFWMYSAFDQFATNFHWHDWEVLHVFVDTETGDPQLYVASSHSRKVPNNEFLDPDPERVPRVLSELGSHSSGLSVNDDPDRFQRLPIGGDLADITNSAIEGIERLADLPAAYGLPRDEGGRLPYLVPELDGEPIYDHQGLPSVDRSDLVTEELTVRSFADLTSPPSALPTRATGLVFRAAARDGPGGEMETDATYDLIPTDDLEHIDAFTGPRLSFEFAVPEFAEDSIASHITTAGVPWDQPRYDDPAADISDTTHRAALAERYDVIAEPSSIASLIATVTQAIPDADAPDGKGLTTDALPIEAVALLQSEPTAVPTFRGVALVQDVPPGDHTLTVNGAGVAPHSETVAVADDGPTTAGVGGEVPLVANERATKLEVDPRGADSDLTDLAVEDDFAGRLYDAPLTGPDALYVHRGGAYTTEVRDADDAVGAFRVTPTDEAAITLDRLRTGKAALATFLGDIADETRADVAATVDGGNGVEGTLTDPASTEDDADVGSQTRTPTEVATTTERDGTVTETEVTAVVTTTDDATTDRGTTTDSGTPRDDLEGAGDAVRGLVRAFAAISTSARRAAERAEAGDRAGANRSLNAVSTALDRVGERLQEARADLPGDVARATDRRLDQARRRLAQARESEKL